MGRNLPKAESDMGRNCPKPHGPKPPYQIDKSNGPYVQAVIMRWHESFVFLRMCLKLIPENRQLHTFLCIGKPYDSILNVCNHSVDKY